VKNVFIAVASLSIGVKGLEVRVVGEGGGGAESEEIIGD